MRLSLVLLVIKIMRQKNLSNYTLQVGLLIMARRLRRTELKVAFAVFFQGGGLSGSPCSKYRENAPNQSTSTVANTHIRIQWVCLHFIHGL